MGGNHYVNQPAVVAFDNVTLTSTAAGNQYEFETAGFEKVSLDFDYAMGAAETSNKILFTLEASPDNGANWYSLVIDSTSTTSALTSRVWEYTGTGKFNVLVDIAYKQMRLSVYESGVATNAGTATVTYTLSGL